MDYKNFDKVLGNELRNLRNKRKLTIRQAGELLGLDNSTVSKWETGHSSISAKELMRYLDLLGVSYSEFIKVVEDACI